MIIFGVDRIHSFRNLIFFIWEIFEFPFKRKESGMEFFLLSNYKSIDTPAAKIFLSLSFVLQKLQ